MSLSTSDVCSRLSHWAVLASGVLVASAASGNPAAIQLLQRPVVVRGTIADGIASAIAPPWFPVNHAILSTQEGELFSRVKDLALPSEANKVKDGLYCTFHLRDIAPRVKSKSFTLTYFPWFRFLAEPLTFEAEDSVADYVAECIRFLLVREGVAAAVDPSHDSCEVRCDNGLAIRIEGMESIERIEIEADGVRSSMDLEALQLTVDRRMFPEVFAMGHEMLATPDRLMNMHVEERGDLLVLRAVLGGA